MWIMTQFIALVVIVAGAIGYSALIPRPHTPRGSWFVRSLAASLAVAVSVLIAVLLWSGGDRGLDSDGAVAALASVGPFVLGGCVLLVGGTYLKTHLWASKNESVKRWLSRR
jgi:hypothetical protein